MLKTLISLAPFGDVLAGVLAKVPASAYLWAVDLATVAAALFLAGSHFDRAVIACALIATNVTSFFRGRI